MGIPARQFWTLGAHTTTSACGRSHPHRKCWRKEQAYRFEHTGARRAVWRPRPGPVIKQRRRRIDWQLCAWRWRGNQPRRSRPSYFASNDSCNLGRVPAGDAVTATEPASPNLQHIFEGGLDEWLNALPAYQRRHVQAMLEHGTPEDVAASWLGSLGPSDTAPYGGVKAAGASFYENLLRELQRLFCDPDAYVEERSQLQKASGTGQLMIVGVVCTAIAPHIGAAAAFIGPAVALTLALLSNAGKATACQQLNDMLARRESAQSQE